STAAEALDASRSDPHIVQNLKPATRGAPQTVQLWACSISFICVSRYTSGGGLDRRARTVAYPGHIQDPETLRSVDHVHTIPGLELLQRGGRERSVVFPSVRLIRTEVVAGSRRHATSHAP